VAGRNPQTMAKRAREQAVREKRDAKRAKKLESAEDRAAAREADAEARNGNGGQPPSP